jgi:hypothetical protein
MRPHPDEPVQCFLNLENSLEVNLGQAIYGDKGLSDEAILGRVKYNRQAALDLGHVTVFLAEYTKKTLPGLGEWLITPHIDLVWADELQPPVKEIWEGLVPHAFKRGALRRALTVARDEHLETEAPGYDQAELNVLNLDYIRRRQNPEG